MRISAVFFLLFICTNMIYAQSAFGWENHSDKRNTADISFAGNELWAATAGGGSGWNIMDSTSLAAAHLLKWSRS